MAILVTGKPFKWFTFVEMANNESVEELKLNWKDYRVTRQGNMMDELRDWYGDALNVNSWWRSEKYNASVGGDKNSCHLDGVATDIALPGLTDTARKEFIKFWKYLCKRYGVIGGISIYDWGLHFDSNDDPDRYGNHSTNFRITDFRGK